MSLGPVVFEKLLFIYDVILTTFLIILSTWLYNYELFISEGRFPKLTMHVIVTLYHGVYNSFETSYSL